MSHPPPQLSAADVWERTARVQPPLPRAPREDWRAIATRTLGRIVLRELAAAGIAVTLAEDGLRLTPKELVTPEVLARATKHKAAIVAALIARDRT